MLLSTSFAKQYALLLRRNAYSATTHTELCLYKITLEMWDMFLQNNTDRYVLVQRSSTVPTYVRISVARIDGRMGGCVDLDV